MQEIEIRQLSKRRLRRRKIPFEYVSDSHYKASVKKRANGWAISLVKTPFARPFRKRDAEPLLSDYKGRSQIFAAFFGVKEAGLMQVELQEWNNSLRVWDFAVWPKFQRKGVGAALMDKCKELAMGKGARRIVLETQTSNAGAIAFYLSQGFELAGMDATNYRNDDVGRCEVRLELAYHLKARGKKNERAL